jgi:WD40 repeat protein
MDAGGRWLALARSNDDRVFVRPFWGQRPAGERVVGRHAAPVDAVALSPRGDRLAAADESGEIRIWSLDGKAKAPVRTVRAEGRLFSLRFDPSGTWLAAGYRVDDPSNTSVRVWDLEGPEGADPVDLRSGTHMLTFSAVAFDPASPLAVVAYNEYLGFFPLERRAHVLQGAGRVGESPVAFRPDGRSLVAGFQSEGLIRTWTLDGSGRRDLWRAPHQLNGYAVDPTGRHLLAVTLSGAFLVSLADGDAHELPDTPPHGGMSGAAAISADGRFAAAGRMAPPDHMGIRVWDLENRDVRVLGEGHGRWAYRLAFAPDGTLFSSDEGGVSHWDVRDGRRTTVVDTGQPTSLALSPNGRYLLVTFGPIAGSAADAVSQSTLYDLEQGTSRPFTSHGDRLGLGAASFDPTSRWIVTGDLDGVVRLGPVTGETPHLLLGHASPIGSVAVSPDGRWIASSAVMEHTVRLWPMPKGPPLQTLPYEDLMTRLRAMTNLRVVPDTTSPQGYRLQREPFPGWDPAPKR